MTEPELDQLIAKAKGMIDGPMPRFDVLTPAPVLTSEWHDWRRLVKALISAVAQLRGLDGVWLRIEPGDCSCHMPPQRHTRWELPGSVGPDGMLATPGHIVTDELIRTYGRRHVETVLLKDLPPLPEQAWEVDTHAQR